MRVEVVKKCRKMCREHAEVELQFGMGRGKEWMKKGGGEGETGDFTVCVF